LNAVLEGRTATYNAILDVEGDLVTAVTDMDINDTIKFYADDKVSTIVFDGNISVECMKEIALYKQKHPEVTLIFEPTSNLKSIKIFKAFKEKQIAFVTPNIHELEVMYDCLHLQQTHFQKVTDQILKYAIGLMPFVSNVIVKLGSYGVRIFSLCSEKDSISGFMYDHQGYYYRHCHIKASLVDVVNVTGAGDTLVGGFVAGIDTQKNLLFEDYVKILEIATRNAAKTLKSDQSVAKELETCKIKV